MRKEDESRRLPPLGRNQRAPSEESVVSGASASVARMDLQDGHTPRSARLAPLQGIHAVPLRKLNITLFEKVSGTRFKSFPITLVITQKGKDTIASDPDAFLSPEMFDLTKLRSFIPSRTKGSFTERCEICDWDGDAIEDEVDLMSACNRADVERYKFLPLYLANADTDVPDAPLHAAPQAQTHSQAKDRNSVREDCGSDSSSPSTYDIQTPNHYVGQDQAPTGAQNGNGAIGPDDPIESTEKLPEGARMIVDEGDGTGAVNLEADETADERGPVPSGSTRKRGRRIIQSSDDESGSDSRPDRKSRADAIASNNGAAQPTTDGRPVKEKGFGIDLDAPADNLDPAENDEEEEAERKRMEQLEERTEEQRRIDEFHFKLNLELQHRIATRIARLDKDEWLQAASFFGVDPPNRILGTKPIYLDQRWGFPKNVSFFSYQLTEAYQMAMQELGGEGIGNPNGGIFANTMGMGKTRSMLLMILIGFLHLHCHLEILEDKKAGESKRHNIAEIAEDGVVDLVERPCPSASRRTFLCPCDPASPFHGKEPRVAPTLVTGYLNSTDAWVNEFKTILMDTKWTKKSEEVPWPLEFRAAYAQSVKECDRLPCKFQLFEPDSAEWAEVRTRIDYEALVKEENKNRTAPSPYQKNRQEIVPPNTEWELDERSTVPNHPRATESRPSPTSGRFVFVVKHALLHAGSKRLLTMMNEMTLRFTREEPTGRDPTHRASKEKKLKNLGIWGRTVVDEFHSCNSESTAFGALYKYLKSSNRGYRAKCWVLSGTPMENGIAESLNVICYALRDFHPKAKDPHRGNWVNFDPAKKEWWFNNDAFDFFEIEEIVTKRKNLKGEEVKELQYIDRGLEMVKRWTSLTKQAGRGTVGEIVGTEDYLALLEKAEKILPVFMFRRTLSTPNPVGLPVKGVSGEFITLYRPCPTPGLAQRIELGNKRMSELAGVPWEFAYSDLVAFATYPTLIDVYVQIAEESSVKKMQSYTVQTLEKWIKLPLQPLEDEQRGKRKPAAKKRKTKGSTQKPQAEETQSVKENANPILLKLMHRDGTMRQYRAAFSADTIQMLCNDSPKYQELRKIWADHVMNRRTFDTTPKAPLDAKKLAKMIFASRKPVVNLITFYGLCLEFGIEELELLPGGIGPALKMERLSKWRRSDGSRIAALSAYAYAESITLTEADTIVVMEPQETVAKQDQLLARINRIGSREEKRYGVVLFNPDSELELRQLRRTEFKSFARRDLGASTSAEKSGAVDWKAGGDIPFTVDGM